MAAATFALRTLALCLGLALGSARSWRRLALLGLLVSAAAFGWTPRGEPSPGRVASAVVVLTGSAALTLAATWPPLVGEAARCALWLAIPVVAVGAVTRPGGPFPGVATEALVLLAALALFAADGSRANAEAGARRALLWTGAAILPAALAGGLTAASPWLHRQGRWLPPSIAALLAVLAFVPAILGELWRVRRELAEEVRLGLLPEADAAILGSPWRRRREKSFGRSDERREYVRSALLLAVARQQQRRRTGQAERLRQLEVLTFRTRIRRLLEARRTRMAVAEGSGLDSQF